MTCKDCLHLHVCKNLLETLQIVIDENSENREKHCKTFENREEYVNLPVFPTIKMLDKQMPKKPLRKVSDYDRYYDFPCYEFFCPACEKRIVAKLGSEWLCGKPQKYCDECGQALDWSDYE